jgi:hypothetical protein
MYNRQDVLRFESMINNALEFKVWWTPEQTPDAEPSWLRLRNGVADLHRRAQVNQATNDRFAAAQAAVLGDQSVPLKDLARSLHGTDHSDPRGLRRRARAVARQLALLHAHGQLEKVPPSHRYRVTATGRRSLTALLAAANATTDQRMQLAV